MFCISSDNSNMRITRFCSLFASLLAEPFFPQLFLKASFHLFDYLELASLSPTQIKSKDFKRSEEPECEWKRSVPAFILHQNTLSLSLALITALPYFEQP